MGFKNIHQHAKKYFPCIVVFLFCLRADVIAQNNITDSSLQKKDVCPEVFITGFKIYNNDLPIDSILKLKTVQLSHQQNSFSISVTISDTLLNKGADYFYKLEGADKNWIKGNRSLIVNYILLQPGIYRFKVKCGVSEKTKLQISINLPFWLSPWFIILCCLLFIGLAYLLHMVSVRRIMAIENVRQKVSRDLHDDIGSTLSTINILSMMAKARLAEDPVKAGEYISKISDNSSRMMEAMDDIVWSINPVNDSMQKIFARMRQFATEVLEPKDVDVKFHFDNEAADVALNMEQRRDFFLIFKEAVNNIAKYSNASQVMINVTFKKNILSLLIKDNGVGFDVQKADKGNGLNNMNKRAEKLKAKFDISSEINSGTEIILAIQIT